MSTAEPPVSSPAPLPPSDQQLWDQKAAFWDALHGEAGNAFHRQLISPSVEQLLNLQPGERVLDIGCGNGALARRLAALGAEVIAVDFSAQLLERARQHSPSAGPAIDYRQLDATDLSALLALGVGQFDAVVSTMAVMDMPTIAPFFLGVTALLKPEGRCVVATMHPAFNSNNPVFALEAGDFNGVSTLQLSLRLKEYLDLAPVLGMGAPDEPNPHRYYHRPLHALLQPAFEAGLVLDGLLEPAFPPTEELALGSGLNWRHFGQFPPVMTLRFRV